MIRLLDLGHVSYLHSQSIYHAVAYCIDEASHGTIIILNPGEPYVCIGYHQVLEEEIDIEYCRQRGFPVLRREVGGGAVYLDQDQLFFQCVFPGGSVPIRVDDLYELFLRPAVNTYRSLGLDARYRPANDIQVGEKKICGTGAGRIGNASVVVGNIMFDFDYEEMSRVLRVQSEDLRDKVYESMRAYVTTLRAELGYVPDREKVKETLITEFREVLGISLQKGGLTPDEQRMLATMDNKFIDPDWLHEKGGKVNEWVKITTDVKVIESTYRSAGGPIRVICRLKGDTIDDIVVLCGFPFQSQHDLKGLEGHLIGQPVDAGPLLKTIESFYVSRGIRSAGIRPEDVVRAIMGEKN
ncbi:MAG: biotin/lipoate A/B protein ligase family protein [Pseudomonadota bacterium]